MFRRIGNSLRTKRRVSALRKINRLRSVADPLGEVRQFLYLDSVALRSIYVSRYGPEEAKYVESKARSAETSVSLSPPSLSSNALGLPSQSIRIGGSTQIQVEKLTSDQSLFRDFLERERSAGKSSELIDLTPDVGQKWSENTPRLVRGNLVLLRINLEPHLAYRFGSFTSSMDMFARKDSPFYIEGAELAPEASSLISALLIDQVAIDSPLADWEWDPNLGMLAPPTGGTVPLRLCSLTEEANYWSDTRKFLFDSLQVYALVRVTNDVPLVRWSPLKVFDSMRGFQGTSFIDDALSKFEDSFSLAVSDTVSIDPPQDDFELRLLFRKFASVIDPNCDASTMERIDSISEELARLVPDALATTSAFDQIEELLLRRGTELVSDWNPDKLAGLRNELLNRYEVRVDGSPVDSGVTAVNREPQNPSTVSDENYLAGEVIAMYW